MNAKSWLRVFKMEVTSQAGDAFSHACQSQAVHAVVMGLQASPVVCDGEREYPMLVIQADPDLGRMGMFGDIGECFLCDAVEIGAQRVC